MNLDCADVTEALFFPRQEHVEGPFRVEVAGATLACRLLTRPGHNGTVLYFHGNGETASLAADYLGEMFLDLGVNVCFAEYRGYGGSTGEPALAAMLEDGERILETLGMPDRDVAVFGRSLGSVYAIELASRRPKVAGLILESGIADMADLIRERLPLSEKLEASLNAAITRSFDHRAKLAGFTGPLLVLHTRDDGLLDASNATRLHDWGGGTDKELCVFARGHHNNIFTVNHEEYVERLGSFVRRIGLGHSGSSNKSG